MPSCLLTLLLLASWQWLGQVAAQTIARARWQVNVTVDQSILVAFGDQQLLENYITQQMTQSMVSSLGNGTTVPAAVRLIKPPSPPPPSPVPPPPPFPPPPAACSSSATCPAGEVCLPTSTCGRPLARLAPCSRADQCFTALCANTTRVQAGLALPLCAECLTTATCGAGSYCAGDADLSSLLSITTSPAAPPPANLYSCQPATGACFPAQITSASCQAPGSSRAWLLTATANYADLANLTPPTMHLGFGAGIVNAMAAFSLPFMQVSLASLITTSGRTLACSAQTILSSEATSDAPPASSQVPASAWQSVSAIASTLPLINAVYVVGYTDLTTAGSLPSALASLISPGTALRNQLQAAGATAKVAVAVSPCASSLAMGLAIQGAPNLVVSFPDPWRGVQGLTWDPAVLTASATFIPTPPPAVLSGIMLASTTSSSTISSSQSRVANTSSLVSTVSALVSGSVVGLTAHGVTVTGPVRLYSGVSPTRLPTLMFAVRASAPVFKVKLFDNLELDLAGLAATGSQPLVMVQTPGASIFHTRIDLMGTATWAAIAQSMPATLRTAIAPLVASSSRLSFRLQAVNDNTLATVVITINSTSTPLQLGSFLSTNVSTALAAHGITPSAGNPVVLTMSAMATGVVTLASLRVGDTTLTHCNPSVPCSAPSACLPALNICYPNTAPRLLGLSCNVTGQPCLQPFRCLQGQQVRVLDLSLLDPFVPAAAPVCVECFQDSHCASRRGSNGLPMICNTGTRAEQAVLRSTVNSANAWGFPTLTRQFYRCIDKPPNVTLDAESACPNSGMQCITNNLRLPSPATFGVSGGKIGGRSLWDIMRVDTLLRASLMYYTNGRSLACPLPIFTASEVGDNGNASIKANAPKAFPNLVLNEDISYLMAGFGPLNYGLLSQIPDLRDFLYVATQLVPALSGGKIPALQMALAVNPCNPVYIAMAFDGLEWAPELPPVQGGQFVGSVALRSVQVAPGGNIPLTTSWKTWDKNNVNAVRTIGDSLDMSANLLAQVEGSYGFSVGKTPGVDIDWLVLKVEGVASLLVYSMAYKRIAFDLVVLPKIEVLNAIIEFDLGKLATGSLGLVITETQGTSRQLDIQLGAGLVVDPASLLQEYIKSNWIRNALTIIFPFLNTRLEVSLNFAFDREGFGARYIMTLKFNSQSGGSIMGFSLLQLFGLPAELSGSLGTAVVVRMPSNGASARRLRSVTFSFFGSLGSRSFLLSITFCTDGSDCTSGLCVLGICVPLIGCQRDVYTMSIVPERMICRSGDGAPNLLNQCTPRCPNGMRETGVFWLSCETICNGWVKDDRCYYSNDRYDTIWSCRDGYIGVTVLTCIRPQPSVVVRKFDISRYDASCRAGRSSSLGLCWETCRPGYDGWVPRMCWGPCSNPKFSNKCSIGPYCTKPGYSCGNPGGMLSALSVRCDSAVALNARRSTLSSALPPTIKWRTRPAPPHRYEVEGVPEHPLAYLVEDEHLHQLPTNATNDGLHFEDDGLVYKPVTVKAPFTLDRSWLGSPDDVIGLAATLSSVGMARRRMQQSSTSPPPPPPPLYTTWFAPIILNLPAPCPPAPETFSPPSPAPLSPPPYQFSPPPSRGHIQPPPPYEAWNIPAPPPPPSPSSQPLLPPPPPPTPSTSRTPPSPSDMDLSPPPSPQPVDSPAFPPLPPAAPDSPPPPPPRPPPPPEKPLKLTTDQSLSVGGFTGDLCAQLSLSWNATMLQLLGRQVDPDDVTKFDCTSNVTEPGYEAVLSWTMERSVADMLGEAMVHNTSISNALLAGLAWGQLGTQVAAFQPSANNGTTPLLALVCSSEGMTASSTVHFVEVQAMCGDAWPSVAAVVTVATTGSGMFTSTAAGCTALDAAVAQYAEQVLTRSPAFPYTTAFPEPWQCNATETGLLGNYTLHPYIAQQFVTDLVATTPDAAALRQQLVLQVVAQTGFPRCALNSFTIGSSRTGTNSTDTTVATFACPYNGEAFASLQAQMHRPPLSILYAAPELCCAAEGGLTAEWMPLSLLATDFEGTSAPADAGCNNVTAALSDQAYAMVVPERRLPLQMGCSFTGQGTAALAAAIDHASIRMFQERLAASASLQARVVQAALAALGPLRCTDRSPGGVISFSSAVDEFASSTQVPPSLTLMCSTAGWANTPERKYAAVPQLCCPGAAGPARSLLEGAESLSSQPPVQPATVSPLQQHQPLFEAIYQKFLRQYEGDRRRST